MFLVTLHASNSSIHTECQNSCPQSPLIPRILHLDLPIKSILANRNSCQLYFVIQALSHLLLASCSLIVSIPVFFFISVLVCNRWALAYKGVQLPLISFSRPPQPYNNSEMTLDLKMLDLVLMINWLFF